VSDTAEDDPTPKDDPPTADGPLFEWEPGQECYLLSPYGMTRAGALVRVESRYRPGEAKWLVTSPPGGSLPFTVSGQDLSTTLPPGLDPYPAHGIPR
jgi:hypothetical protein